MNVSQAASLFFNYQRLNLKKNTIRNYEFLLNSFVKDFGDT